MKIPSFLSSCIREMGKRKWSGTKDTCPECVCDADIASLSCRDEDKPKRRKRKRERARVPSIKRNATTCTGWKERGKGKEERSPRCRRRATPFRRFASDPWSWRYGGTATQRTEPEGESRPPNIPAFDASHYGNAISRASLENYVDVMPHLLASSPPPSYRHPISA